LHEKDLLIISPGESSGNPFSGFRSGNCSGDKHACLKAVNCFFLLMMAPSFIFKFKRVACHHWFYYYAY